MSSESPRRVAIVTGGSGGMGPAIGLALARRGVAVVVFCARRDSSAAVAAVAAAVPGCEAASLPLDVSSRAGVADFFRAFQSRYSRLDFLVNVSGDCPRTAIEDVDEEELFRVYSVNAAGPLWMCQLARPLMWASGGGAIVNVGSLAGEDGANAASVSYTMAKAALRGMMMQLAKQGFPPGAASGAADRAALPLVRVNNVSPGPVRTPMLDSMTPVDLAKVTAMTLTGRVTGIEEVAAACVFLCLDSPNSTGQTIQINGGVVRT